MIYNPSLCFPELLHTTDYTKRGYWCTFVYHITDNPVKDSCLVESYKYTGL